MYLEQKKTRVKLREVGWEVMVVYKSWKQNKHKFSWISKYPLGKEASFLICISEFWFSPQFHIISFKPVRSLFPQRRHLNFISSEDFCCVQQDIGMNNPCVHSWKWKSQQFIFHNHDLSFYPRWFWLMYVVNV